MHKNNLVLAAFLLLTGLCGCFQVSERVEAPGQIEKLRTENKGVALIHTSLHDSGCWTISIAYGQPDASGRYFGEGPLPVMAIKGGRIIQSGKKEPSQIVLPAGEYGIAGFSCSIGNRTQNYTGRVLNREGGRSYFQPIVIFRLGPGEVVDIGSVQLPSHSVPAKSLAEALLRGGRSEFSAVITRTPEPWLRNLAENSPDLYKARIERLMTLPKNN